MIVMTLWVTEGSAGSVVDLEPHELSGLGHQVRFGINKPGAAWLLLLVKAERQQTDVVRRDARPWVGSGRPPQTVPSERTRQSGEAAKKVQGIRLSGGLARLGSLVKKTNDNNKLA